MRLIKVHAEERPVQLMKRGSHFQKVVQSLFITHLNETAWVSLPLSANGPTFFAFWKVMQCINMTGIIISTYIWEIIELTSHAVQNSANENFFIRREGWGGKQNSICYGMNIEHDRLFLFPFTQLVTCQLHVTGDLPLEILPNNPNTKRKGRTPPTHTAVPNSNIRKLFLQRA